MKLRNYKGFFWSGLQFKIICPKSLNQRSFQWWRFVLPFSWRERRGCTGDDLWTTHGEIRSYREILVYCFHVIYWRSFFNILLMCPAGVVICENVMCERSAARPAEISVPPHRQLKSSLNVRSAGQCWCKISKRSFLPVKSENQILAKAKVGRVRRQSSSRRYIGSPCDAIYLWRHFMFFARIVLREENCALGFHTVELTCWMQIRWKFESDLHAPIFSARFTAERPLATPYVT